MSDTCYGRETDVLCLKLIKASLRDPFKYLNSSWNFDNTTAGFICKFSGIECWHPDENRVINIRLSDFGLEGPFPVGVMNCTSLTGLYLSNNNLSGPIPANVSEMIPYVTTLDLSFNKLSGEIPRSLGNFTYLNILNLEHNRLGGQIPWQLSRLNRLTTFNVADNNLTGPIPLFNNRSFPDSNFANNFNLCGKPLEDCKLPRKKVNSSVIIGSAVGGVVFMFLIVGVVLFLCLRRVKVKKEEDLEGNKWAKSEEGAKDIKVFMLRKSVPKLRLIDLVKATDNFNKDNIIGPGRTGTMYRATHPDGSFIAVKRLQDMHHSEKHFVSEMLMLGSVNHHNLVPLLGFCVSRKERLLVYKYMPNKTLYHQLHMVEPDSNVMEWPLRLRIGIGVAKGLAWLHHNCNPCIIHRNISSKCVLLDDDFEPKISDFGLARLMNPDDSHLSGFTSSVFGGLGYIAPEYGHTILATPKGDVYSFGTILLELVTGKSPTCVANAPDSFKGSLAEWVTDLSDNSLLSDAIDKSLIEKGCDGEIFKFLDIACHCVLPNPKERPNMFEVCQLLRGIGKRYPFTDDDDDDDEILMPMNIVDV